MYNANKAFYSILFYSIKKEHFLHFHAFHYFFLLVFINFLLFFTVATWTTYFLIFSKVDIFNHTCFFLVGYVAPRNLPSTGFFPFLQTLMCNKDTYCHNTSQENPTPSKSPILLKNNPLAKLVQGESLLKIDIPPGAMDDATKLMNFINNMFGKLSFLTRLYEPTMKHFYNFCGHSSLDELMASMTLLKKTICQSVLPMMNMSSPTHLTFAVVTFCNSNNTVFEVMLVTLNQILIDLMLTEPDEMVNVVGATLFFFDHLQNQSSLWEAFLALPQLFSSTSVDQIAGTAEALLTNIQGVLHIIQTNFPNASASAHAVHPLLAGGISITRYIQNWPGKHVSISLGDVLVLYNDSLSEMVKPVLQEVEIPLDKAIALTLDREVVRGFVCNNRDNPMWLTAACTTGTVDMFLGWISPENLAEQVLLKWSKHVAQHDLLFAKGLLEALMGGPSPGGQGGFNITRTRRSVGTQPQNIEEDLVRIEGWRSVICHNDSTLLELLPFDWMPLIYKVYYAIQGHGGDNVTLPMILSEWHLLLNKTQQFGGLLEEVAEEMGAEYWMNWVVENNTSDFLGTLLQSAFHFMVRLGQEIEQSQLWPEMKDYFHMAYWILNYRPGITTQPANCSIDLHSFGIRFTNNCFLLYLTTYLLTSTGLAPLLPVILNDGPLNITQVFEVASKLGRLNQHIFTFNETHPTMPELERLIMQFLSSEGNLTMSLALSMGNTLLTYSEYISPEYVARLREAIQPFTNQTSAGIVEAILSAIELVKTVMDSPDGNPTTVILGYIQQLEECIISLLRLRKTEQVMLPNGQLITTQVTDLYQPTAEFLNLLTPEGIETLAQAGPDAAQDLIAQKFMAFLPAAVRQQAATFLQDFKALQHQMTQCATGQNCLAGISEIFTFLDQILDMMVSAKGNVTIEIATSNSFLGRQEYEEVASTAFSLLLSPNDVATVTTFKQTLLFIRLVMANPNITVSHVQNALQQSNLTIEELNYIASLAGAGNMNDLVVKILTLISSYQCFELQPASEGTTQCVVELINGISSFLMHVPALQQQTAILSIIPLIVNKTLSNVAYANFSSNPDSVVFQTLNSTLANVKMALHMNNLDTPEIMNEFRVLENILKVAADPTPLNYIFNPTMGPNPFFAVKDVEEMIMWYLKRLENATSSSSISDLLYPFFHLSQMQVALQLAQTDLSIFVSNQIDHLMHSLQYPLDAEGLRKIGQAAVEILQRMFKNNSVEIYGFEMPLNATLLAASEFQINLYLNIIQHWMAQPNVFMVLTSMLHWGNSSMSYATPVNDIHHLLQTILPFLDEEQRVFISLIGNITQSLSKALTVAQQPNGLQSDHFITAISEAIQTMMSVLTPASGPVPVSLQQNILGVVQYSIKLIVHPDLGYASARNASLLILKNTEGFIQQIIPEMVAQYMLGGVKIVTTYFETISTASGPDNFNELILNEMKTIHSLLPPNSTSRAYISALINITHFILASGQGTSASDLKMMLEAVLSIVEKTEHWESIPSFVSLLEKALGTLVKTTKAENGLIVSLQVPVMTLMTEIAQSVNSSHFNLSEFSERMQHAIERTLVASQQANGTLECSDVLKIWEGVREAAGLNHSVMAMWCNASLQPVIEAYIEAQKIFAHMNMTHTGMGPVTVNATAARIVKTVQSFYYVSVNQSHVLEQFVMTFSRHLDEIAGQPLSPEAQLYWYKHLQDMQLEDSILPKKAHLHRNSLDPILSTMLQSGQFNSYIIKQGTGVITFVFNLINLMQVCLKTGRPAQIAALLSLRTLSEEVLSEFPFLQPYVEAVEKALAHVLNNYDFMKGSILSKKVFSEAAMIFLYSVNITSDDMFMMWGNFSDLNAVSIADMMINAVKMMVDMKVFGEAPMVYEALEQLLTYDDTRKIAQKVAELFLWLTSTQPSGPDFLTEALPELARYILSFLKQMIDDLPINMGLFEDLPENVIEILRKLLSTFGVLPPMDNDMNMRQQQMQNGNNTVKIRRKRELSVMPMRSPMDDFIDLIFIDYSTMFSSLSVLPTEVEIIDTAHVFFSNPDLGVVVKGATRGIQWNMNPSREKTIDAVLGMASVLTLPGSSIEQVMNAVDMLPDDFPFSSLLKNITKVLASESQGNFTLQIYCLSESVCALENTNTIRLLMHNLGIKPGEICHVLLPGVQNLVESLVNHTTTLFDIIYQTFVGDPSSYRVQNNWGSVFTQGLGFNISSLSALSINITMPAVTIGEMLQNKTAFILDVQQYMGLDQAALYLLMETPLPNNNLQILSWLVNLRHCNSTDSVHMKQSEEAIFRTLCSMSVQQLYSLTVLMTRHVNLEKFIYRMLLPEEMQNLVGVMLQMAKVMIDMINKILPAVGQLQSYMHSMQDLNLGANNEFIQMSRGQRKTISSKATFVTISRALCSNGILALLGISKIPEVTESYPSFTGSKREEMIERFKIPRNATPFCTNMYLDMVNTTGGAIAWAFLKPMLMGHILYTPDTPLTRAIMEKSNLTLHEFGNLRKHSQEWIESSSYLIKSSELLSHTLPMLQNSLGNSFVKNFIEMQTDINVGRMKETLSNFSNMTEMLEKNKDLLNQITALSTLMVDLSSCIKFDRFRGYDSADQLNTDAQEFAKNRDLYASVIFKLPKEEESQKSSPSTSTLPPKVSYTIRMHMDNVMRTDRVRDPYFVKDPHVSATMTMRYNRGFVYLQETIDRAIIETQAGRRITEPAVQLQAFPYPCHLRDEYLEAISFVFPLMLMIAWVLFVADFVKKLVHERELRLHEYMKMMGVNPLSHFFAWFVECACYLGVTIIILTLLLKYGRVLPHSDGFLIFLYLCDYGLSILAFSYLVSSFFDQTYIAGLSGSLLYILSFFPFIVVMAVETKLTFSQKSLLSLFSPTCFSYASQYINRYEAQAEGIQWSNSYSSPIAGDMASFGWLCWLMLIDSILYFILGAYIRMVFPGKYGIAAPWYFPFTASFWSELCCSRSQSKVGKGLFFTNIMQSKQAVFSDDKGKGQSALSSQAGEDCSELPVGVSLHGLTKIYGERVAIENLNVTFYEGQVTTLLGHNGAGKTTTMSLLTGLFAPSSGTIEVYGKDMQTNINTVRKELGVCMQYDVLFEHMTTKEHLLLYGQIKAPHWSRKELHEQVRTILEETGMYAHRHKRVGTLSGGMKRKLSISIAFIGGSRLVVLDEPTTGVDPCSRRNIWDIVIQHKKHRTIIMSTHHLDEAEVLSDRIAFLEKGGLKCCGSPFYLKDKLGQGYKLTITKKTQNLESEQIDDVELKSFIQAHVPEATLKEAQGSDLVYLLPPFSSSNSSSYRSLLTALDANLDALQLGCYGISDTTLEEVFLHMTHGSTESWADDGPLTISETVSDSGSIDSFPTDATGSIGGDSDKYNLTGLSMVEGAALVWQQIMAILIKRFHHSRRDWKGLISQLLLPVLFVLFAMGLGSIKNDMQHFPELELSPALYNIGPSYSFFSNQNPNSSNLVDAMLSFPGMDNACLEKSNDQVCSRTVKDWESRGNSSKMSGTCKCLPDKQVCDAGNYQPPHKKIPSSQTVYNLSGINLENYLVVTGNDFIRNRYGGFAFGKPLPLDLQIDLKAVPKNRTLSKVWFNPEGHHTMPAYLNSLNNIILRANLPADKDPREYAISVSSHPYFGRRDDEDSIVQGMLQILVAMCVLTGYSITTASFAIYEVNEHHTGSKRLQHIAGISEPLYWAVNFFYDMALYMIPVTVTVAVVAAFQISAFTDRENLGAIALLLVLFGFATFPWMYLLSSAFKDAEMAFITYVCINLFISINTIASTSILYFLSQISVMRPEAILNIFNKLSYVFVIFPQFNFGNGLMTLARKDIEVQILSGYGIDAYKSPFCIDTLGWMFLASFIEGVLFFTLRLLLNKFIVRKIRRLIFRRKPVPQVACEDEDEDVASEHLRVASGAAGSDILQVNQLTKVYQHFKKKVHAVKRLSVGIPAGECFGLLGVNGAGKTTTFKMLTGDVSPTDGTAQIRDRDGRLVDIMECRNQGINIGYCPQVDALDDLLTGEEHLYFYARVHGISKREIRRVVNYLLKRLELTYHRNIITDGYSCGTRRKLSTALALVGHPQILLLDEPSSGMDPRTKRHLWKIISEEVKGKCAVVLTSHSMEECEALCSRLAIMVKGQFRCLGSLQHIKNRFGSGFTVKMYLAAASCDAEAITGFMQRRFPSTYLKDQHSTMVEYHVPVAPGGVADIFDQLESNKNALQIKHFSVSQTTLDEVRKEKKKKTGHKQSMGEGAGELARLRR
uniref:ATP-binding cassette, sub-family A (ABC1), member 12 n=1 Tax=Sphaeramia orbicularis TaxID=375764 RepID=A0A673B806_9TELE